MTIGITYTERDDKFANYVRWMKGDDASIEIVKLSPEVKHEVSALDGVVFSGGVDIHPRYYNGQEKYSGMPSKFKEARDEFEFELFEKAGIRNLRRKSEQLTGYLEFLLERADPDHRYFRMLTPADPRQRGCQLSLFMLENGRQIFDRIVAAGVFADWREPDVIRLAPVPLYNTFEEVFRFGEIFRKAIEQSSKPLRRGVKK